VKLAEVTDVNEVEAKVKVYVPAVACVRSVNVATPLTAVMSSTGVSLKWYTVATAGTASLVAPTPVTTIASVKTYYVSQIKTDGQETVMAGSQLKIYTPTHFMWANLGADSSINFGFGNYVINGENITRNNIYSSRKLDSTNELTFSYELNEKGYSQIVTNKNAEGKESQMIEDYETLTMNTPSSNDLEGAWKQVNTIVIKNNDTAKYTNIQYKIFQKII
jgi:hypothetical protein